MLWSIVPGNRPLPTSRALEIVGKTGILPESLAWPQFISITIGVSEGWREVSSPYQKVITQGSEGTSEPERLGGALFLQWGCERHR